MLLTQKDDDNHTIIAHLDYELLIGFVMLIYVSISEK
jgi:hypothetical protein